MPDLPPEDLGDVFSVGPVENIPIIEDEDRQFTVERQMWSNAFRLSQAMYSADELIDGLLHEEWRVRHEVIDRLIARAADDTRTVPALLDCLASDESWQVRDKVATSLCTLRSDSRVVRSLVCALDDPHEEVRSSAKMSLSGTEQ